MGNLIVLEGMDGSGKSTQTRLLARYFEEKGMSVKQFHFPTGEGFSGKMINDFLQGNFGKADEVDPYFVAMLYALDRKKMAKTMYDWLEQYDVVLLDRYTLSNVAYQCAKLPVFESRMALSSWILDLEHGINHLPSADLTLYMGAPLPFISKQLSRNRQGKARDYLEGKEDIHEKDIALQREVNEVYTIFCEDWEDIVFVNCVDAGGEMRGSQEIHQEILGILREHSMIADENSDGNPNERAVPKGKGGA